MHVEVDLGFSSLVVLVSCVVVVLGIWLVTRHKWRAAATRKEEIKRLLVLAAEEAARAEFEATSSYGAVSVSRNNYQCAVCFCPTTTRCARCKAVRYCSGKCQIIHWRRGHKEECHPPTNTYDDRSNYQNVATQDQHDMYDGIYNDRSVEISFQKPVLSDSILSPEASLAEGIKVDPVLDTEGTNFIHESPGTSFSGFSTPTGSSFSEFSTPEFSDSDSLDSFATLSKANQSKPYSDDGKSQCSSSSSGHSIGSKNDDPILEPAKVSSDFWGRTLDSVVTSGDAKGNSSLPNSCGPGNSKSANDESFLHFKFNLSGSASPSLHAKSSKANDSVSDDALPSDSQGKSVDTVSLSEKNSIDAPKVVISPCMSCEWSKCMDNNASGDSNASSERKSVSSSSSYAHLSSSTGGFKLDTDAPKVCRSPSSRSERSNVVVNDPIGTPHLSKSRLSSSAPQTHLTSSISGQSTSNVRLGKVENVEPGAAFSSQMASCSPSSVNGLKSSVWKVVDQFRGSKSGQYSEKCLSLYDLFVKLYTSNKVDMQPCGLINCGNSCYANVVLQCLAFTPPLTAYFAQGLHSKACVNKDWCFSCEFENLILKAKEGKTPLSPIGILSQLQNIGSPLGNGREEDAHEFLRYAIDAMDSHEETSLMGLTFGGYLRSKIKCMKCHSRSERQERMMDLTVEIEGDIGRLEDALKRFTGTEILDGNNKYQCSRCESYEKAKKKLTILEAPNVLTIALKRFQSGKFGKLNKSIRFPEILDLAPYMSGTSDKSPIYRLYGLVVHLDVMNAAFSGHYVCYVKNIQNKWFKIDDSTVTVVELERVLTKGAYMLLYARCSPRAPRLIRNKIVSADLKNKCSPSKINPKNTALESRTTSVQPSVVQPQPNHQKKKKKKRRKKILCVQVSYRQSEGKKNTTRTDSVEMASKLCDSCKSATATLFCRADSAFLCVNCDSKIHAANKLASRHARVWVCEVCEQAPAHVTCKADAAALCITCDRDIHSANPLARRHERVPVTPFYDSSANSVAVNFLDDRYFEDVDATGDDVSREEAEAASWLLSNPGGNNNNATTKMMENCSDLNTCQYVFGSEMDPYLDLEYVDPKVEVQEQNSSGTTDCVVPVQSTKNLQPPALMDGNGFELDFTNGAKTFGNYGYSTHHCLSHSVSSSSLEVGVVPDGSTLTDISNPYSSRSVSTGMESGNQTVQQLSAMDREARVLRYREKRKNRKFEKTIRYASRKAYAETRPRVKGRFAKRSDIEVEVDRSGIFGFGVVPSC